MTFFSIGKHKLLRMNARKLHKHHKQNVSNIMRLAIFVFTPSNVIRNSIELVVSEKGMFYENVDPTKYYPYRLFLLLSYSADIFTYLVRVCYGS